MSSGGWRDPPRLLMEGSKASRTAAHTSWSCRKSEHRSLRRHKARRPLSRAVAGRRKRPRGVRTREGRAASPTPPAPDSLWQETSSAGPGTRRQAHREDGWCCSVATPARTSARHTHHVEVESSAEVHLLQQQQQPAPHLRRFEEQPVHGLHRSTLAQEVQDGQESQVLGGEALL